jgi:hypothetical protein
MTGNIIIQCRICKKEIDSPHGNKFYCEKCADLWNRYGAFRYNLGNGVFVWVKGNLYRAVVNGKDVIPIRETKEFGEWAR